MLHLILTIVQVISAAMIIGLVLLQRGKGAEAGAGFGAGASGTVFGARGASTALSRATAVLAAIFMINSLALAYLGTADLQREPLPPFTRLGPNKPVTGWIAISALEREHWPKGFLWLDAYKPLERVGKTIDLYYISGHSPAPPTTPPVEGAQSL